MVAGGLWLLGWRVLVDQDAHRGALRIVELPAAQRPVKRGQPGKAEAQRDRYEEDEAVHFAAPLNRSALATTMIEEVDMAMAAISGVTLPITASGTARTL